MKTYIIHLYKYPQLKRGWIAYSDNYSYRTGKSDVVVTVEAKDSTQAKNRAITAANNNFVGVAVICVNGIDETTQTTGGRG